MGNEKSIFFQLFKMNSAYWGIPAGSIDSKMACTLKHPGFWCKLHE